MKPLAVILAAGMGTRLRPLTNDKPKCLVPVAGRSLLLRMLDSVADAGIEEAIVVTGYLADKVEEELTKAPLPGHCVFNPHFEDWNNFYSLLVAREKVAGRAFVKLDGDVIFEPAVLGKVMDGPGWIRVGVDVRDDLGEEEMKVLASSEGRITAMSKGLDPAASFGESVGIEFVGKDAVDPLFDALEWMVSEKFYDEYYEYAYDTLARTGRDLRVADLSGMRWNEIDDLADLRRAEELFS